MSVGEIIGLAVFGCVVWFCGFVIGFSRGQNETEQRWSDVAAKARWEANYGAKDPNAVFFSEASEAARRSRQ